MPASDGSDLLKSIPGFAQICNGDPVLCLSGGIDNLFNKNYVEHLNMAGNKDFGFPAQTQLQLHEPGRNFLATVQMKF
ncbi:MAG: hypothetical protein P4L95_12850 [Rouxiella aceris]|uniref:hypothetical protein n=1 Tax=Rouxiella aceris TaxID=2703884 RepID=UPI00284170B8|nr:hypothetical protein [Rouxiella aceris]MDR3432770.1 hypothetical protein [Rouxiella aceris]